MHARHRKLAIAAPLALIGMSLAAPALADGTPECNLNPTAPRSTECGTGSDAGIDGTALGANAAAGSNGVAIGSGSSATASSSVAIGGETNQFAGLPSATASGASSTAIGSASQSSGTGSVALGAVSTSSAFGSTALGTLATATHDGAVALGFGSSTDRDYSVSVGGENIDGEFVTRQITNVAAGSEDTDAVNVLQLNDAVAGANANAAAAQATADTALADAAAAQATADTAIVRADGLGGSTAAALGGGSVYNAATGAISAPSYSIGGESYGNAGAAFEAVDDRLTQLDARMDMLGASNDRRFRRADGGIAAAMALGGTMIVPDSIVSMSFNLATYRGEQGFSGAVVVRASPRLYVSGGFAGSTVRGSTGGRVGLAFGF